MYDKLVKFSEQFGHVHLTESYVDKQLYDWLVYQRKLYWKGKLDGRKLGLLKEIGVDMTNKTINRWEEMFEQLVDFKEKNGHLYVCQHYNASKQLIHFVKGIRRRPEVLTEDRKRRLNELGFVWKPGKTVSVRLSKERAEQSWFKRFEELKAYKQQFGTCKIPMSSDLYYPLGKWVSAQRYKINKLSPERVACLEEIGLLSEMNIGRKKS